MVICSFRGICCCCIRRSLWFFLSLVSILGFGWFGRLVPSRRCVWLICTCNFLFSLSISIFFQFSVTLFSPRFFRFFFLSVFCSPFSITLSIRHFFLLNTWLFFFPLLFFLNYSCCCIMIFSLGFLVSLSFLNDSCFFSIITLSPFILNYPFYFFFVIILSLGVLLSLFFLFNNYIFCCFLVITFYTLLFFSILLLYRSNTYTCFRKLLLF